MLNRLTRLGPMLILMVLLTFYTDSWNPIDIIAAFVTTLHKWWLPGYVAAGWTILIEIQFYVVFPFLVLFCRRYGPAYPLALMGTLIAIRFLVWIDKGTVQELAYTSIIGRADQFLLGMTAALVLPSIMISASRRRLIKIAGVVALGCLLAFFVYFHAKGGYYTFDGQYPTKSALWIGLPTLEAICYATMIVAYLAAPDIRYVAAHYASQVFAFLGRISYSMYLLHFLVFRFCFIALNTAGIEASSWWQTILLLLCFGLPSVVLLSTATYFLIEKPFLLIKRPATR